MADVYSALNKSGRTLGSFESFINRRKDFEHAYNKMRGVTGKPEFDEVYSYLKKFLTPFIQHDRGNKVWNSNIASWSVVRENAQRQSELPEEHDNSIEDSVRFYLG